MMGVTIYHNPGCRTSRTVLAMIRARGVEPEIIEYLKHPPSRKRLLQLIKAMGVPPRAVLRAKGDIYTELGLAEPSLSDEALIDAMLAHPVLIERPIVASEKGVRLCRPKELVLEIL
jgi:arsenate reductase